MCSHVVVVFPEPRIRKQGRSRGGRAEQITPVGGQTLPRAGLPPEKVLADAGAGFHLARLPAVPGKAFAEAVDAIERFLVPLECQSTLGYGFIEGELSAQLRAPQLSEAVDDAPKARTLLRLLNLPVGNSPDAVIPDEFSVALHQMVPLAPELASDPTFRRLAAASRR